MKSKYNTAFNIISLSIGIIGILLTIYTYKQGIEKIEPILFIEDRVTKVISAESFKNLPIKISTKENKPIRDSIYLSKIGFGNKGKKSIKSNNILKDIVITINKSKSQILDFSLVRQTRDVVGIEVKEIDQSTTSYKLNFKMLEANDGTEFQILYLGDPNIEYTIDGVIEGKRNIEVIHSKYKYRIGTTTPDRIGYYNIEQFFYFE